MTWIAGLVTSVGTLVTLSVNTVTFNTQYVSTVSADGTRSIPQPSTEMSIDLDEGLNTMGDALESMTDQEEANRKAEEEVETQKAAEDAADTARKEAEEAQAEEEKEAKRKQAENEKELAKEEEDLEKEAAQQDKEIEEEAAAQEAEEKRLQEEYEAQQQAEEEMYYYGQGY